VISAMAVSFVHGSNDGQKGIGLIMLVLIGIVPAQFVLDLGSTTYQIERTRDATLHLNQFYQRNQVTLGEFLALGKSVKDDLPGKFRCNPQQTEPTINALLDTLKGVSDYHSLTSDQRIEVRRYLLCLDDTAKKVGKLPGLDAREKSDLDKLRKDLTATTEYAPFWVITRSHSPWAWAPWSAGSALVLTIGEKIGQAGHDLCPRHVSANHHRQHDRSGQHLQPAGIDHPRVVVRCCRSPWLPTRAACKAAR